jgi:hypothetical protein
MSFDSVGRLTPNHKTWDHQGTVIPVVEHSEGIRPHGEFMPAAWLPVQFYDKYYEVWYVALPGKILAFDGQGRVVPAQYGLAGATITYTADDVSAGVIDVRTGAALVTGDIGTFAVSGVSDFMGTGEAMTVSKPVGVAPYAFFQWAGDGSALDDGFNPAGYRQHNFNLQHRVAILCDYVLELPLVPAKTTSAALANASFASSKVTFTAVSNLPVATNTMRTRIAFANNTLTDAATRFVVQKSTLAEVLALGDWHIDYTTGVVTAYAASDPGGGGTAYSITYYHYASAPASVSKFASAVGNLKGGDFVKCDSNSNYQVADASDNFQVVVGQVLDVENLMGKDYLDRVRTAYESPLATTATGALPGYAGQMDQMPGTATGGVPDKIHLAGAADKVVRVNLVSR